jgi:hypothetical protein
VAVAVVLRRRTACNRSDRTLIVAITLRVMKLEFDQKKNRRTWPKVGGSFAKKSRRSRVANCREHEKTPLRRAELGSPPGVDRSHPRDSTPGESLILCAHRESSGPSRQLARAGFRRGTGSESRFRNFLDTPRLTVCASPSAIATAHFKKPTRPKLGIVRSLENSLGLIPQSPCRGGQSRPAWRTSPRLAILAQERRHFQRNTSAELEAPTLLFTNQINPARTNVHLGPLALRQ